MNKIKRWLYSKFLPSWCKEQLLDENARLRSALTAQKQETERLQAYIEGLHTALRMSRKITIRNGGEMP